MSLRFWLAAALAFALLVPFRPLPAAAAEAGTDGLAYGRQLIKEHPLTWEPCEAPSEDLAEVVEGAECAILTVPLNYSDPSAGTIGIRVARRQASDPAERIGVLLFNPGGPGAPATPFVTVRYGYESFFPSELRRRFDIIAFDPRGVAEPSHLDCGLTPEIAYYPDAPLHTDEGWAAHVEHAQAVAAACAENAGDLLPHIGVVDVVRDMELLRIALGEKQISYAGFSAGTVIGAVYVETFPRSVRAAVLDSAVNPALDAIQLIRDSAIGFEHMVQGFLATCGADPSCPFFSDGDPASALNRIIERVEHDPPVVTLPDGTEVPITRQGLRRSLDPLTNPRAWHAMAVALQRASEGDFSGLINRTGPRFDVQLEFTAIECLDTSLPRDLDLLRELAIELAATTTLGDATGLGLTEALPCAFWPAEPTRPVRAINGADDVPVLVLQNQGDGQTPYHWGPAIAGQLPSSRLVSTTAWGHIAMTNSACGAALAVEYLVTLRLPIDGSVCPANPMPWLWSARP